MARKDQPDPIPFRPKPNDVQNILGSIQASFLDRYPRVLRTQQLVEMPAEEAAYFPPTPGYQLIKLENPPISNYVEVARFRLKDLLATSELLCYRILKYIYGDPDVAVAALDAVNESYAPEADDEDKAWSKDYVPFSRERVRRGHAEYVQRLVDETISAIIDSLSPESAEFCSALRRESVLARDKGGRIWVPSAE